MLCHKVVPDIVFSVSNHVTIVYACAPFGFAPGLLSELFGATLTNVSTEAPVKLAALQYPQADIS